MSKAVRHRSSSAADRPTEAVDLARELEKAREQQTATSEVLKVISSSVGELAPVFSAILANAARLCEATYGVLWFREGDAFRAAALHGDFPPAYIDRLRPGTLFRVGPEVNLSRMARCGKSLQVPDLRVDASYLSGDPLPVAAVEIAGVRTILAVPMIKGKELIGAIGINRKEVKPFTDEQIELVENFAAQAVIAIENARLLNELRQRTDDLTESLEQQTATSEVLRIISISPGELEPVFNTILANATRICEAKFGLLYRSEGDVLRTVAMHGAPPALVKERQRDPIVRPAPATGLGQALATRQPVQIADILKRSEYFNVPAGYTGTNFAKLSGARTVLGVPMLKDNELVGAITIFRKEVRPFTDKQIELVRNFAAQAVIAIENTRLLSELRELLQQQTATSEVLKVIAGSSGELTPVFEAMLENAVRICDAKFGTMWLPEGDAFRAVAVHNAPSAYEALRRNRLFHPAELHPKSPFRRLLETRQVIHIADLRMDQGYLDGVPTAIELVDVVGARAVLMRANVEG